MTDDDRLRSGALSNAPVDQFIRDGFIRIDRAFPPELAEQGRAIMWREIPFDPHDPATWTKPVVRLPGYGAGPFQKAANTPVLHDAFDRLVGKGRWVPRFMAQQSFGLREPYRLHREDGAYSPVETSIRQALRDSAS